MVRKTWHPLNRAKSTRATLGLMAADPSALQEVIDAFDEMEKTRCTECRLVNGYHRETCSRWTGEVTGAK